MQPQLPLLLAYHHVLGQSNLDLNITGEFKLNWNRRDTLEQGMYHKLGGVDSDGRLSIS